MKKTKILFLTPLPPPFYGSAISSGSCLKILQSNNDFEVKNIKLNYSESFDDMGKFTLKKITGFISVIKRIVILSVKFKPDIVYIMPATGKLGIIRDFTIAILSKALNKNIIIHLRTRITEKERQKKVHNFLLKKAFSDSKVIVLGEELINDILPYSQKKNIYVLPNAIESTLTEKKFKIIKNRRLNTTTLRLVFISNMIKSKGWLKALQAASILDKMNSDFTFTFAGNWPSPKEETEFFKFIKKDKLSNKVNYQGYVNEKEKHKLLSDSDILIFPTEYPRETFGRVIIEAMEYGIPVIANSICSIPSIILHSKTGFLLKRNSPEEIVEYILAIKNKADLIKMGDLARKRFMTNYELSVFSDRFISILTNQLSNNSPQQQVPDHILADRYV
jgi:glycosyltransferase involved in cell wall biosynthesis